MIEKLQGKLVHWCGAFNIEFGWQSLFSSHSTMLMWNDAAKVLINSGYDRCSSLWRGAPHFTTLLNQKFIHLLVVTLKLMLLFFVAKWYVWKRCLQLHRTCPLSSSLRVTSKLMSPNLFVDCFAIEWRRHVDVIRRVRIIYAFEDCDIWSWYSLAKSSCDVSL